MAMMLGHLYSALKAANVDDDTAQKAAEEVANYDTRVTGLEASIQRLDVNLEASIQRLDAKIDARFNLLSWMVGFNLAITLLVLGKSFLG